MNGTITHLRTDIKRVFEAALEAVEPGRAVARLLSRKNDTFLVGDREYRLSQFRRIAILGAGKATARMAQAISRILKGVKLEGMISVKELPEMESIPLSVFEAGHPAPDEQSEVAATEVLKLARQLGEKDLAICLISGGASALWAAPAPGLTWRDKAAATEILLKCGADIHEINSVRKHLSAIKGGRLAVELAPATLITLAISDVVGDDPGSIGSGPTVGDPTTFADAMEVVEKYDSARKMPASVFEHLRRGVNGELPETPMPGDQIFAKATYKIIASNKQALAAATRRAEALGYRVILEEANLTGEAKWVGKKLAFRGMKLQDEIASPDLSIMLISGGETTVTLKGSGQGGRNQELVLAAALQLRDTENIVVASMGTDGIDGPTDAAGAVADGTTLLHANEKRLDAQAYLDNNDSHHFFKALGDLIHTGPTGTNVMDIQIVAISKKR